MVELDFKKYTRDGINQAIKEYESLIGMTIGEAVEKQMPKAPVWSKLQIWACPVCGCLVHMSHCSNCGQRIDWEAVDNGDKH